MSARTRAQIKALVEAHTGRTKDTLESSLCDSALREALLLHHFKDAQSEPSDIAIVEDATSVSIAGVTGLINIVTARIVEADGSSNRDLILRTRLWWDSHVINPEDNAKGWPQYALRFGTSLYLDRPSESGLEVRLRCTTEQAFAADSTVCPIAVLDIFVEHYVTAGIYESLTHYDSARYWRQKAFGVQYEINGTIGGSLAAAVKADTLGDTALETRAEPPDTMTVHADGVSIQNLITDHEDYGNTRWWS